MSHCWLGSHAQFQAISNSTRKACFHCQGCSLWKSPPTNEIARWCHVHYSRCMRWRFWWSSHLCRGRRASSSWYRFIHTRLLQKTNSLDRCSWIPWLDCRIYQGKNAFHLPANQMFLGTSHSRCWHETTNNSNYNWQTVDSCSRRRSPPKWCSLWKIHRWSKNHWRNTN